MGLFSKDDSRRTGTAKSAQRATRPSSGWAHLLTYLREEEGLRVLDIGPTSSGNINFLTELGHSVYMADLVGESKDKRWNKVGPEGEPSFLLEEYLAENLEFGGRHFDVVLFWDTSDFVTAEIRSAIVDRLHAVMVPGGRLLAFFHVKPEGSLHRYHLRDDGHIEVQSVSDAPVVEALSNRQIEHLFRDYSNYRFFLAKDNLREVVVTR